MTIDQKITDDLVAAGMGNDDFAHRAIPGDDVDHPFWQPGLPTDIGE